MAQIEIQEINSGIASTTPTESQDMSSVKRNGDRIYLCFTGLFFLTLFIVFLFLPRPEYSELEKRDLNSFPEYGEYKSDPAAYTSAISDWFSNTQPFRDHFLTMSMNLRDYMKFGMRSDEESVSFHATTDNMEEAPVDDLLTEETEATEEKSLADENAKVANAGIIVVGNPPNVRAMMAYGGTATSGGAFISTVNNYAKTFPNQNIFVVVASSPGEFYMPEKVKGRNKPEQPTLDHIKAGLIAGVKYVDVHSALQAHKNEDIFLRTDHHWAPLGAYYAAEAFARTANVPFKSLDSYERQVVHGYIGSMYGYSKDIAVKNSPEDFVYYTPKGLDYKTTFITYSTNKDFRVTGASKPFESSFFKKFKDGSGSAYCTFMGGDQCLVHVKTGSPSNRKLLIIKDSFGNAVPGYLFYSFSDIHVVDFRYFNKNIQKYVSENGITDIAFVFNIFNVCNSSTFNRVNRFLSQKDGELASPDPAPSDKEIENPKSNQEEESTSVKETQENTDNAAPAPATEEKVQLPAQMNEENPSEEF